MVDLDRHPERRGDRGASRQLLAGEGLREGRNPLAPHDRATDVAEPSELSTGRAAVSDENRVFGEEFEKVLGVSPGAGFNVRSRQVNEQEVSSTPHPRSRTGRI